MTGGNVEIAAEIVAAEDAVDVSAGAAVEATGNVTARVDGICRPRNMRRRKAAGTLAAVTRIAVHTTVGRARRHRVLAKTILCCQANRWRSIVGVRNRHRRRA